jgi:restriction system protein
MAKRKSAIEDLIDVAAKLPWWIGVLLALLSFVVLHLVAGMEIVAPKGLQGLGDSMVRQVVKMLAMIGQYLLPIAFLIGAAISVFGGWKRGGLHSHPASSFDEYVLRDKNAGAKVPSAEPWPDQYKDRIYPIWKSASAEATPSAKVDATRWNAELLDVLEWKRFEEVCAGLFERLGFSTKSATCGADGGIDIHLYRSPSDQPIAIVQCKAWTGKVGVKVIRELRGVMTSERMPKGIIVTTRNYSDDAMAFAKANQIYLMNGDAVLKAILKLTEEQQASLLQLATAGDYTTPTCASCGVKMIARKPKSGGKPFWGCVNYPDCKMKLHMAGA